MPVLIERVIMRQQAGVAGLFEYRVTTISQPAIRVIATRQKPARSIFRIISAVLQIDARPGVARYYAGKWGSYR